MKNKFLDGHWLTRPPIFQEAKSLWHVAQKNQTGSLFPGEQLILLAGNNTFLLLKGSNQFFPHRTCVSSYLTFMMLQGNIKHNFSHKRNYLSMKHSKNWLRIDWLFQLHHNTWYICTKTCNGKLQLIIVLTFIIWFMLVKCHTVS